EAIDRCHEAPPKSLDVEIILYPLEGQCDHSAGVFSPEITPFSGRCSSDDVIRWIVNHVTITTTANSGSPITIRATPRAPTCSSRYNGSCTASRATKRPSHNSVSKVATRRVFNSQRQERRSP